MSLVHHVDENNALDSVNRRRYRRRMNPLISDCRHAFRGLIARPTYAAIVVCTLALVIGAAAAVLAVLNATVVRPLAFPQGDRVVQFFLMPPGQTDWTSRNPQSVGSFLRFRQHLRLTESVEGMWSRERVLGGDAEPEVAVSGAVSAGLFALFGGTPARGRTFTEDEDRTNAKVVVLGHGLWERRFGADPAIVGKTVLIDREPFQVIGVMPPRFVTAFTPTEFWTPLNATEATVANGNTVIQSFGRLREGATVGQLQEEVTRVMASTSRELPKILGGWSALVLTVRDAQFRLQRPSILALAGGVVALLLIACANLANLVLAQIVSRRSQWALRAALGGGRAALVRLQLLEILLLAGAGAAAGLIAGRFTLPALLSLDPSLSLTFGDISIDWRVQMAVVAITGVVAVVAGLVPLLRELRGANLLHSLADGNRRSAGSPRNRRIRAILVGAECALSVVLLACSGLLLSAFSRTSSVNPGFDPQSVLAAQIRIPAGAYATEAARSDLITRVLERVRQVPGVESAGATLNRFVPGFYFVTRMSIEGKPAPDGQAYIVHFRRASTGYFNTMRIRVLRGRDFLATDVVGQPLVAVVSRQLADMYWPGEDPIGRRILRGSAPAPITVVGIVDDVRDVSMSQPPSPTVYIPFSQNNVAITPVSLVVRTGGADPLALSSAVRSAVLSIDPQQPIDSVTTVSQFLSDSLGPQRFRSSLLVVLGGIGLMLAALGIYGVTSRAVVERTSELGVRLALGATPGSLARLVVWQAMRAVLIGLGVGIGLAAVAAVAMFRLLPNLELAQGWTTVPAILVLATVAVAAAAIPARRAVTLSPVMALRSE